jgi:hypothetical protein
MAQFDGPIPGQSLTTEPNKYPWERPPEMVDPEQAIVFHLDRLTSPRMMKSIVDMLDMGIDVVTLSEGFVRLAVSKGIHSIDVGLLIAPVIHEFIVSLGEDAQIDFEEGLEDLKGRELKEKMGEKAKAEVALERILKERGKSVDKEAPAMPSEIAPQDAPSGAPEEMPEKTGLMARRM